MTNKFIIEAAGVKREIPLPFKVCCTPAQVRNIGEQLIRMAEVMEKHGASYGWLGTVFPEPSPPTANVPVRAWSE